MTDDYNLLRKLEARSAKVETASDLLRTSVRFIFLCKRLETQMSQAIPFYRDAQAVKETKMDTLQESREEQETNEEEAAATIGNLSELAKAAETLKLLEQMLAPSSSDDPRIISINRLKFVEEKIAWISNARALIIDHMEDMVVRGLKDLVSPIVLLRTL